MFNLLFSKLNQLHKRKGFVFLGLASLSVAIAFVITSTASYQLNKIAKTGLLNVTVGSLSKNISILGSGVNIEAVPATNYLKDASFEPYVFKEALLIEDGNKNTMYVSNKQAKPGTYGSGFFVGANYRVMTENKNGILLKKQGKISKYEPNQIGAFQKAPIIGDILENSKIRDYTTKDGQVIVVGDNGMIIKGINTQSPSMQLTTQVSNYTGISHNNSKFFACAVDGTIISSSDGESWEKWTVPYKVKLNSIASSDDAVVAIGDNGVILTGIDGVMYIKDIGIYENITDIIYGDNLFVAVTDKGNILKSTNGITWVVRNSKNANSYKKIEYSQNYYILLTSEGTAQVYSNIDNQPLIASALVKSVIDATIMSRGKILLLNSQKEIYESNDQGNSWQKSKGVPPADSNMIGSVGDDEILCSSSISKSYISKLVTEIQVDSVLKEGTFQAGDLCYIDIEYSSIPKGFIDKNIDKQIDSPWEFAGEGYSRKILMSAPTFDGVGVMKIDANFGVNSKNPYAVISQKIAINDKDAQLLSSKFFTLEFWAKKDKISDSTLKVWISGTFDSIGTTFENVGASWKKFTYKFVIPPNLTADQLANARFNIGTTTNGIFYVDKVYLGISSENGDKIPLGFRQEIQNMAPSLIRTNFLKMGTRNVIPNRWALNGKIDEALNLIADSGKQSSPWLVIDSMMGESELRNFTEYMAGSISTTYGKYRMQNGTTLPWINQFDRLLIEFSDTNMCYMTDVSKALAVNEAIKVIETSPYYKSIKNKIVFVDGMIYSDGLMLSRADFSASDFNAKLGEPRLKSIKQALLEYGTQMPRNPDRPSNVPINLMRSTSFDNETSKITMDEYVTLLLDSLGTDISASLSTLPSWPGSKWSKAQTSANFVASYAAQGEPMDIVKTQIMKGDSLVDCYAFRKDGKLSIVFSSHNTNPVAVSIDIPYSLKGSTLMRFNSKGDKIEEIILKKSDRQINVMPQNVIVLSISILA